MKKPETDHIVLAANSLEEGASFVAERLGVVPSGGGEHIAMGTHNRLVRLGADCYLEIIAVNPDAPPPRRPRWFELDTEAMREKLRLGPRLVAWALRTDRIEELARDCACPLGTVEPMSRGALHWRLTLTEDGRRPGGGLIPFLIQWEKTPHIAAGMPESGCRLVGLQGFHPHVETIAAVLRSLEAGHRLELEETASEPSLVATIRTPGGLRTLT